jgi:hypothetical protein
MNGRTRGSAMAFAAAVAIGAASSHGSVRAQVILAATDGGEGVYAVPRTPWGDPDLEGVWDYRTITPLERPRQFGDREHYTDEEIAELEARASRRMDEPPGEDAPTNLVHAQYMTDPGTEVDESGRTSLIIDPPDGRIPPLTAQAEARQRLARESAGPARPGGRADTWLDRTPLERCITWGLPQAILPGLYNNNILITQAPGYVTIVHEMVHDARVVPLDDRPFGDVPRWLGESRGYWDGDTLVVETRNFNGRSTWRGAGKNLHLTERYTRVGDDRIDFRLTIEDETQWTAPFTVAFFMRPTEGGMYEYACHEGNYALRNMLEVARDEALAAREQEGDGR